MECDQLELFDEVVYDELQSKVIKELRLYRALKVRVENMEERQSRGITNLYPVMNGTNVDSDLKVKQMERALDSSLDKEERKIIEMKYLSGDRVKDVSIYMDLGMKKDRYYILKKNAITYLATALGII